MTDIEASSSPELDVKSIKLLTLVPGFSCKYRLVTLTLECPMDLETDTRGAPFANAFVA